MITFPPYPIPIVIKENEKSIDGYLLYVESGGSLENDIWTCVHCEGGVVRHYTTAQIRIFKNLTFGIQEVNNKDGLHKP